MAHGARYPCHLCVWKNGDANDDCPLRTFEGIRENNRRWIESGADPNRLKEFEFQNCRSVPLSIFPETGLVADEIPLQSLHLKLGLVNQCFAGLQAVFPGVSEWLGRLKMKKAEYHGGVFEGRQCDRLLDHLDVLENLIDADNVPVPRATRGSNPSTPTQHPAKPFLHYFKSIKRVRDNCFRRELGSTWEEDISSFRQCFELTGKDVE